MIKSVAVFIFSFLYYSLAIAQISGRIEKAEKYYELRDFDKAQKLYLEILEESPNNPDALWRLGDIYYITYDFEEAYTHYSIAAGLDWRRPEQIRRYVEVLLNRREYKEAYQWANNLNLEYPEFGSFLMQKVDFAEKHFNDPSSYTIQSHPANTKHSDFGACFIAKDYLVYSSARDDIKRLFQSKGPNEWAGKSMNQLFVASASVKADDDPLFYRSDLENNYNEGPVGVSGDGNWVAVTKNNFLDGIHQILSPNVDLSLYLGKLDEKGNWNSLKPFEHNIQGFSTGMASLGEEANVLFFASDRPDGFGGFDLYVSTFNDGYWSVPRNLGPAINTPGNEITPYFDGGELYFSSDLHPGLGGFDIYRASIGSSDNITVSKIYHLGTGINSEFDDSYMVFYPEQNRGFLTSNRNPKFAEDIFSVHGLGQRIKIKIIDAKKNLGISNAKIEFENCSLESVFTDHDGETSIQVLRPVNCELNISKEGYGDIKLPFISSKRKYWEIALHTDGLNDETYGIIKDGEGKPLPQVYVKAEDMSSGWVEEAVSNEAGQYSLNLKALSKYKIYFIKPGYSKHHIEAKTAKNGSGELPTVSLNPTSEEKSVADSPISSDHSTVSLEVDPNVAKSGYSIQLGAYESLSSVDLDKYETLNDIGQVYTRKLDGAYKMRLGIYNDKATALNIKEMLVHRGFNETFVVTEDSSASGEIAPSNRAIKPSEDKVISPSHSEYAIQLGVYSQPKWFDIETAQSVGNVEERTEEGLSTFYIVGIKSQSQAQEKLQLLKRKGFADAFIVKLNEESQSYEAVKKN